MVIKSHFECGDKTLEISLDKLNYRKYLASYNNFKKRDNKLSVQT